MVPQPFLELVVFGLVRVEALDAPPDDAVPFEHLEGEVAINAAGLLYQLFLVLDLGEGGEKTSKKGLTR